MSWTYAVKCRDCKEYLEVGYSTNCEVGFELYDSTKHTIQFQGFMNDHGHHSLGYGTSESIKAAGYKEAK